MTSPLRRVNRDCNVSEHVLDSFTSLWSSTQPTLLYDISCD